MRQQEGRGRSMCVCCYTSPGLRWSLWERHRPCLPTSLVREVSTEHSSRDWRFHGELKAIRIYTTHTHTHTHTHIYPHPHTHSHTVSCPHTFTHRLSHTYSHTHLARARLARKNDTATGSFRTGLLGELDCRGEETPSPELVLLI